MKIKEHSSFGFVTIYNAPNTHRVLHVFIGI